MKSNPPQPFEPFERWLEVFTASGRPLPQLPPRSWFREGFLAAQRMARAPLNRFGEPCANCEILLLTRDELCAAHSQARASNA